MKKILVFKSVILIIMVLQDVTTTILAKPTTRVKTTKAHTIIDNTQPLYELQLAVWPTDVDDIIEAVVTANDELPPYTIIEQPEAIGPVVDSTQDDDEEDVNGTNVAADDEDLDVIYDPSSDLWPTILGEPEQQPEPTKPDTVIVLENYHHKYANGSEEYKLVLSNGMVNYQRIDLVLVNGVLKPVQKGYYTVPYAATPGQREFFQTTYYQADVKGYNVTKTEISPRNPTYDTYLDYVTDQ